MAHDQRASTGRLRAPTTTIPGGKSWNENTPAADEMVLYVKSVASFVAVTTAQGNTAPVESVTLPLIPPRNVCATAIEGSARLKLIARAGAQTSVFQGTINHHMARRFKMGKICR